MSAQFILMYILLSSITGEQIGDPSYVSGPFESDAACLQAQHEQPIQTAKDGQIKIFQCYPIDSKSPRAT